MDSLSVETQVVDNDVNACEKDSDDEDSNHDENLDDSDENMDELEKTEEKELGKEFHE